VKSSRLERSNAELERFAYVASHDLKTPLRGIGNITEFLEEDLAEYLASEGADPGVARNLERLGEQSQRMHALIDGILDYSRIGGNSAGSVETLNISDLLDHFAEDLGIRRDQLTHDGVEVFNACAAVYFEQVLQNLIANSAVHHHDLDQLQIHISLVVTGSNYRVSVSDNGPGIAPQHHERIFQVFQRLEASGTGTGTGIGLSIVKKIVENQGCSIDVISEVGEGASFAFDWPVVDGRIKEQTHKNETAPVDKDAVDTDDELSDMQEETWAVH
jgi:signal transduction histidine kinase